jgi:predicted nucleic acid-binding protein
VAQSDALIAAAEAGIGARVATGNPRDFAIPGVVVEHWPVGE